jgi:phosphonate transport system permease protein
MVETEAKPVPAASGGTVLRAPYRAYHVALVALIMIAFGWSAQRQGLISAARTTVQGLTSWLGMGNDSTIGAATARMASQLWPPQLSEETRLTEQTPDAVGAKRWWERIEIREREIITVNPVTLATETTTEHEVVRVEPLGYAWRVLRLIVDTVEIGALATALGVLASVPLAVLAARNYSPHPVVYHVARGLVALLRSIPELISALFLVLAYGFGPAAGILALSLHCTGFLGKFFAEEIEHCDPAPQEALTALGASRLKVLRYAVWPPVAPHYLGYISYVLDRNVRMATVIGLVGAGGIGQELKGRYDLFQYGHVTTIILAIFLVVLLLDLASARLRQQLA